jgi:hypothetical protein
LIESQKNTEAGICPESGLKIPCQRRWSGLFFTVEDIVLDYIQETFPAVLILFFQSIGLPFLFMVVTGTDMQAVNMLIHRRVVPNSGKRNSDRTSKETKKKNAFYLRRAGWF